MRRCVKANIFTMKKDLFCMGPQPPPKSNGNVEWDSRMGVSSVEIVEWDMSNFIVLHVQMQ